MTNEMFIGGLIVLTVAAVVVIAMTTTHSTENGMFDWLKSDRETRSDKRSDQSR